MQAHPKILQAISHAKTARTSELAIPEFMKVKSGEFFKLAPIHEQWHQFIRNHKYVLILGPRDHGKSEQIAIGYLLTEIGKDPKIRAGLGSSTFAQAVKRVKAVGRHIEFNRDYRNLYRHIKPDKKTLWASHALTVKNNSIDKDPTLEAFGMDSNVTGSRKDLIVLDDPLDKRAISSIAYRESVQESFDNDVMNLLEPDGRLVIIGTVWNLEDLYHVIRRKSAENGFAILFQAYNENLEPLLWEAKWSKEDLEKRRAQNRRAFDRGFRNIAVSDKEALFKRDVISKCIKIIDKPQDIMNIIKIGSFKIYIGVDLAISKSDTAAYTVIFVIAVSESGQRIPLDIFRDRISATDTGRKILEYKRKYNPDYIFVENVSYQESQLEIVKLIAPDENMPIEGFMTGKQKYDEYVGLPGLASEFENDMWEIYMHRNPLEGIDDSCDCNWCTWIDEMVTFPVGSHTDTIMGCWFAREARKKDEHGRIEFI